MTTVRYRGGAAGFKTLFQILCGRICFLRRPVAVKLLDNQI